MYNKYILLLEFFFKSVNYNQELVSFSSMTKIKFFNLYYNNSDIDVNNNVIFNRLTKEFKESYSLTNEQKEALVGIILGDGSLERRKTTHNTRLRIEQAYPEKESYLLSVYELFKFLTFSPPKIVIRKPDKRTGKIHKSMSFKTVHMPCLNYYYDLFYDNSIKVIPENIHELLTARGLAYWIMDDGSISYYNQTILHTRAFTKEEVILLQNALKINFELRTRIEEKQTNQWIIYIPVIQKIALNKIVGAYMHETMLYKIKKII
jgi:hypothetical protein